MSNYSFEAVDFSDGTDVIGHNLTQLMPHTPICSGRRGLRFIDCNLMNCDIPADAQLVRCRPKHKSFCSWLHPRRGLPECGSDCQHVTVSNTITVDGGEILTVHKRQDKSVG